MNINFANKFNMTIFWWSINRVWKFVYYGMHVLVCILHNVVHHFIREKSLIQEDGFFIYLAAPEGQGFFVHIFSSSFMDLFVFICFPFHFYLFIGVSIFKTMLSLWWCVTIIVIIWNIIKSFDLLFLLNCCRVFRFIWCFHFENISISTSTSSIYFSSFIFFFHSISCLTSATSASFSATSLSLTLSSSKPSSILSSLWIDFQEKIFLLYLLSVS